MWKLFIDDERVPETIFGNGECAEGWTIARSSMQAMTLVEEKGMPAQISFDHDLGAEDTGAHFLKWLIEYAIEKEITFVPKCTVHSQNPAGAKSIKSLISSWKKYMDDEKAKRRKPFYLDSDF